LNGLINALATYAKGTNMTHAASITSAGENLHIIVDDEIDPTVVPGIIINLGPNPGYYYGSTTADGSAGDDTISFGHNAGYYYGSATADGSAGDDTISFEHNAGYFYGSTTADGGAGDDTISFGGNAGYFYGSATADGGAGDDTISFGGNAGYFYGSATADGGAGADQISFGAGASTVIIDFGAADGAADELVFKGSVNDATILNWENDFDLVDIIDPSQWIGEDDGTDTTFTFGNATIHFLDVTQVELDTFMF
jgi:hypothetical protein